MSEDYSAQQPLATWNDARSVWEMPMANLFCAHLELFSATWPAAGMMRDGQAFELPTQAHRTTVSESSFLPTPNTLEHLPAREGEARERQLRRGGDESRRASSDNLREDILTLMPTTRTSMANGSTAKEREAGNPKARIETAVELLPTVTTQDASNTAGESQFERNSLPLNTQVVATNWGKFEPAIRRWEQVIGRAAPAPTKPDGKDGAHRLSSAFTEWMMGLPEGWITDCGLTRNEELKACGNGVVPQQAELALRLLFDGTQLERERESLTHLPTPTVSDTFTANLKSSQQKPGSMHSVTLPQIVASLADDRIETGEPKNRPA